MLAPAPRSTLLSRPLVTFTALYAGTFAVLAGAHPNAPLASAALLAIPMIWLSTVDMATLIIPDGSVLAIGGIGLASQVLRDPGSPLFLLSFALAVLTAAWAGGEIYFRRTGRDGLGIGDAKLMAAGSLCVGPLNLWLAVFLAAIGGIVPALLRPHNLALKRRSTVPFGPFLAYAFFLVHMMSGTE